MSDQGTPVGRLLPLADEETSSQEFEEILRQDAFGEASLVSVRPFLSRVRRCGTHKHPAVRAWFKDHPRFQVHFTPTSAS